MIRRIAKQLRQFLSEPALEAVSRIPRPPDAASQIQLRMTYRQMMANETPLPALGDIGFRCYSQTDEDGILLFLLSVVGTSTKRSVEICAGDGIECNTANLIINHGWHGLLVDGDEGLVARGRQFYARSPSTAVFPPAFVHSWVTRENINRLLDEHGFVEEIDVLSIDLDGIDYWIWDAIEVARPRVVVVEYQDILGPSRSWTVPYSDDFSSAGSPRTRGMPNFAGASLPAFVKLGRRKDYRLVGINRYGYNAFFIRNDLGGHFLPEVDLHECFNHPKVRLGMQERFPSIKDFFWVEV